MYSFSGNCAATVPISTFMCLWAIYIIPWSICQFCCGKYVDGSWEYIRNICFEFSVLVLCSASEASAICALEMDLPSWGEWWYLLCTAPPAPPQLYKVYLLHTAHPLPPPPPCGQIHFEGHWKGLGSENRDFFGPLKWQPLPPHPPHILLCTEQFRNQQLYVKCLGYASGIHKNVLVRAMPSFCPSPRTTRSGTLRTSGTMTRRRKRTRLKTILHKVGEGLQWNHGQSIYKDTKP
jgi:hypothetical protein